MMQEVVGEWTKFEREILRPCHVGLINETWFVGEPPSAVLQKIHPIFGREVHLDIAAITAHLCDKNMLTPQLIKTKFGQWSHQDESGGVWRMMTFIPGVTVERVDSDAMAFEAGRLVGRWHKAVDDLSHEFHFQRSGVHDTFGHMERLGQSLRDHKSHRLYDAVERAAHSVLEQWEQWKGSLSGNLRICHGDLKISNLRFDHGGQAISLLDLDTMGYMALDVEMGDAWRSWCNSGGEDQVESFFNTSLFEASLRGYCSARRLDASEREGLEWGTERIALELSARFLVDALDEKYFGWDASRFATRGEHNLLRGEGQLALANSVGTKRAEITRIIRRVTSVAD